MAMVSMKTEDGDSGCCPSESNPYGYGLRINLTDDQVEALGIKSPPTAGARMQVTALAVVVSVEQRIEADGDDTGPDICLSLQITDLELAPATSKAPLEDRLYTAGASQ